MKQWYAIHCRPQREKQVGLSLQNILGLNVYLPEVVSCKRGDVVHSIPLFPCYLFVQASLGVVTVHQINTQPGVVKVVSTGGQPVAIPHAVIEALQGRVDALNEQGGLPPHTFKPGDVVRLKSGPMHGLEGVFQGAKGPGERVRILIEFMGKLNTFHVDANMLEEVANATPSETTPPPEQSRPPRRTRGKGRKINYHRTPS